MIAKVDRRFDMFIEQFGQPTHNVMAQVDDIERFRGRLPDRLLHYWGRVGFSGFANGLMWVTNPEDYAATLEEWLGGVPIQSDEAFNVIARSAFGDLYVWGDKSGYCYNICPMRGWIIELAGRRTEIAAEGPDRWIESFFFTRSRAEFDQHGTIAGQVGQLFSAATDRLGCLEPDEVFAFEPALAVGGSDRLEGLVKRNVFVCLSFLAEVGQRQLVDRTGLARMAFE